MSNRSKIKVNNTVIKRTMQSNEMINLIPPEEIMLPSEPPYYSHTALVPNNKIYPISTKIKTDQEISNVTEPETEIGQYIIQEIEDEHMFGIEDGRKTKILFQKYIIVELSCAVFSLMGLGLAILSYDMEFVQETGYSEVQITLTASEATTVKLIIQWLTFISTIILYPLVIIRYQARFKWMKAKKMISSRESMLSSGVIHYLWMELALYALIPHPFLSNLTFQSYNEFIKIDTKYSINDLLSILVLLRVFIIFRIFLSNSRYYSNAAHRLCSMAGIGQSSYTYVIKCIMKNNPLELLFTSMLVYILTFAYAIKVCERPLIVAIIGQDPNLILPVGNDVSNFYNAMWLMIVTMATVGYGDFYPRTLPGRAISFLSCICGVITVSLTTITLQNLMEMNNTEIRAFHIIEHIELTKKKKYHASFILTNLVRLGFFGGIVKKHLTENERKHHLNKISRHLKEFKRIRRNAKNMHGGSDIYEEISRHFVFLREDYKQLENKLNALSESNLKLLDQLGLLDDENEISHNVLGEMKSPIYSPYNKRKNYRKASPRKHPEDSEEKLIRRWKFNDDKKKDNSYFIDKVL